MSIEIFPKRHLSVLLSSIRVRPSRPRLQASQTTSSGGSARKPAFAPPPPDDAVGMACASTRHRGRRDRPHSPVRHLVQDAPPRDLRPDEKGAPAGAPFS